MQFVELLRKIISHSPYLRLSGGEVGPDGGHAVGGRLEGGGEDEAHDGGKGHEDDTRVAVVAVQEAVVLEKKCDVVTYVNCFASTIGYRCFSSSF